MFFGVTSRSGCGVGAKYLLGAIGAHVYFPSGENYPGFCKAADTESTVGGQGTVLELNTEHLAVSLHFQPDFETWNTWGVCDYPMIKIKTHE